MCYSTDCPQLPRCLYGLFFSPCLHIEKFTLSLSPHQSRPQTEHTEFGTECILCSYDCDVPPWVIQTAEWRGQAGRRQGQTCRGPAKPAWAVLWKVDTPTPLLENWLVGYYTEFLMIFCTEELLSADVDGGVPGITEVYAWKLKKRCHMILMSHYCFGDDSLTHSVVVESFRCFSLQRPSAQVYGYSPPADATWPLVNGMKWFPAAAL